MIVELRSLCGMTPRIALFHFILLGSYLADLVHLDFITISCMIILDLSSIWFLLSSGLKNKIGF